MTMFSESREPRVHHLHPEERPNDEEERHNLLKAAVDAVDSASTSGNGDNDEGRGIDLPYLYYISDIPEGNQVDSHHIDEHISQHIERIYPRLTRLGFIAHLPWHSITIDWHHIQVYAKYVNPRKRAHWTKAVTELVNPQRERSIKAQLKQRDKYVLPEDGIFATIQDMSEVELVALLDHASSLFGQQELSL